MTEIRVYIFGKGFPQATASLVTCYNAVEGSYPPKSNNKVRKLDWHSIDVRRPSLGVQPSNNVRTSNGGQPWPGCVGADVFKWCFGAFSFGPCKEEMPSKTSLLLIQFQADQHESLRRCQIHNVILCTIKWVQNQALLTWSHQQMTTGCTTSFKVVQPVVTDLNRSYYQSWNFSTNGTTNEMAAQLVTRPAARHVCLLSSYHPLSPCDL